MILFNDDIGLEAVDLHEKPAPFGGDALAVHAYSPKLLVSFDVSLSVDQLGFVIVSRAG